MGFLEVLAVFRPGDKLAELAEQVAERCRAAVLKRVEQLAPAMSAAESLGYIRARAAAVVHHEVGLVDDMRVQTSAARRQQLASLTTDAVVRRVAADLVARTQRPAARRRAA